MALETIGLRFQENDYNTKKYGVNTSMEPELLINPIFFDIKVDQSQKYTMGNADNSNLEFEILVRAFERGTTKTSNIYPVKIKFSDYNKDNGNIVYVKVVDKPNFEITAHLP
jgi:hypothetical protein